MIKKIHITFGVLAVLIGITSILPRIVSFCKISSKVITVRVCKSVVPKRFSGKTLFKDANNIWVLGKNNLDRWEYLSVAFDTGKYSHLQLRIAAKTETVQLWR
jgi:hypothetical protein